MQHMPAETTPNRSTIFHATPNFALDTVNPRLFFGAYREMEIPFHALPQDGIVSIIPHQPDNVFYPASVRAPYGGMRIKESPEPVALLQRFTPFLDRQTREGLMIYVREHDGSIHRISLVDYGDNKDKPLWKIEDRRAIPLEEQGFCSDELQTKFKSLQPLG